MAGSDSTKGSNNNKKKRGILSLRRIIGVAPPEGETPEPAAVPTQGSPVQAATPAAPEVDNGDTQRGLRRISDAAGLSLEGATAAQHRSAALQQLEEQLHQRLARWARLDGELQAAQGRIAQLEADAEAARAAKGAAEQELQELRTGHGDYLERLAAAEAGNAELRQEIATHRDAILGMQQVIQELEARLREGEQEKASLAIHAQDLEQALEKERGRHSGENAELLALQARLAEAQERHEHMAAEGSRLKAALAERDAELERRSAEIAALEQVSGQVVADLESQRRTNLELEADLRTQRKLVSVLGKDVQDVGEMAATIQALDEWVSLQMDEADGPRAPAAEGPRYRLIESVGGPRRIRYPLYKRVFTIGRAADSDMRVGGPYTSRHHARILTDGEAVVIEDLGSANGVIVNENAVDRCVLRHGDLIDIGGSRFRYLDEELPRTSHQQRPAAH